MIPEVVGLYGVPAAEYMRLRSVLRDMDYGTLDDLREVYSNLSAQDWKIVERANRAYFKKDQLPNNHARVLKEGEALQSRSGEFHARLQSDGRLVVSCGEQVLWASEPSSDCVGPFQLELKKDNH